ncbi:MULTISPECIES: sugar phosphate isomerase/epimerase [unclassified Streptomyces]|uniref:sugar phosphate isomerase/epimerase family protein n=1 Tax=unclassified Streptomyces TaxID=2593676 RepID=UPI00168AD748|nr:MULTISPECIES: sugar phosphate isomerase/epimerase family protein [unclassified Streptomyces]MBD3008068.1 sugar phosphate isomerase/epimerase [Streptomyces sp. 5-10]
MNDLGVHALVWTGDWTPEGARTAAARSREAGYDLVEISLHDPGIVDVKATREVLAAHELGVACSRGLAFDSDVSSEDPATAARGEALLRQALHLTHDLGGHYFGGVLYGALGKYGHPPTPKGREHAVQTLRRLAAEADGLGVTLGLEVVNRYESNLVNTARQALELIDEIGAANVVVHLDTYHMNIEEQDFARPVRACGDRLGYVHIGESHRGYLGSGTVDFPAFFHALADIGYQGPITFESFSSAVVAPGLSHDLAVWRDLWADGADLAAHARSYIADQLKAAHAHAAA